MNRLHATLQAEQRVNYLMSLKSIAHATVTLVQTVGLIPRTSTSNRSIFS